LHAEGSQVQLCCDTIQIFSSSLLDGPAIFYVSEKSGTPSQQQGPQKVVPRRHVRRLTAGKGANDDRHTLEGRIDARMGMLLLHRCIFIYDFLKQNNFVDLRIPISHLADSISGIQSSPSSCAPSCGIKF